MVDIGFGGRLAYLRWLDSRGRITPKSDREFAAELGVGESWVRKWKVRPDVPERRTEEGAFQRHFGEPATRWLYEMKGAAPQAPLWPGWLTDWERTQQPAEKPPVPAGGVVVARLTTVTTEARPPRRGK